MNYEQYLIGPNGDIYEFMGIDPIGETILYSNGNKVITVDLEGYED